MPQSDAATMEAALSLFADDEEGCHLCLGLLDLGIALQYESRTGYRVVQGALRDLSNISILVARIEWMRTLAVDGTIHREDWRTFSGIDIENIFVQIRSAMDHSAEILQLLAPRGGQLPDSFRKLRTFATKSPHRLPPGMADLIASTAWFDQMRTIRDSLVHGGGQSIVFGDPADPWLFQVYGTNNDGHAFHPALMFNENVARFDRFLALLMANVFTYLDRLGVLLQDHKPEGIGSARSYSSGLPILRGWMKDTLEVLSGSTAK